MKRSQWMWAFAFVTGGLASMAFLGTTFVFLDKSESLEYCISCHEMENNVYAEYKQTAHYTNRTGVQVVCADCHIPKTWFGRMYGKIGAIHQLYHKIAGDVDTAGKFEAKRLELAETVWAEYEANGSQPCKNCHSFKAMDIHKQSEDARDAMEGAMEVDMSCIECHKGIAHKLPEDYR
ncbi:MAG: NapC/NirT family cytochrome c [Rhodospirillales bacterium]|nr:NapC/NirT family cytochrome c [Planctomycetota bacterium]MBL6942400.1 NapC/NirT family cytochrome c [Rhodospirillales bacterium]